MSFICQGRWRGETESLLDKLQMLCVNVQSAPPKKESIYEIGDNLVMSCLDENIWLTHATKKKQVDFMLYNVCVDINVSYIAGLTSNLFLIRARHATFRMALRGNRVNESYRWSTFVCHFYWGVYGYIWKLPI